MILRNLILVLLLLVSFGANGQSIFTIVGLVKTSENKALPLANIYVFDLGIGVTTNEDGEFVLHLPKTAKDKDLIISHIGYKKKTSKLSGSFESLLFVMEEESNVLDELIISSLTAKSVVEKAISNISLNYLNTAAYLTAFNREELYQNDSLTYIDEALTITYSAPYFDFKADNQVKVIKGRRVKSNNFGYSNLETDVINGIQGTVFLDFIKMNPPFIKIRHTHNYDFQFLSNVKLDGAVCYQISFYSYLQRHQGVMFIERESYAFVKANIELTPVGLRRMISAKKISINSYKISSTYLPNNNGKWCFNHGMVIMEFTEKKNPLIKNKIVVETVVTQSDLEKVTPFRAGEIVKNKTFSKAIKTKYDSVFWKNQNIIKASKKYFQAH